MYQPNDLTSHPGREYPAIGFFGGSFDPVHIAHCELAAEVQIQLGLDEVRLMPCHIPAHKPGLHASTEQRVEMLNLARSGYQQRAGSRGKLLVDLRELRRNGLSYTRDTVAELRQEYGSKVSLHFILGWDSWENFTLWYKWQEILRYVNLVLLKRPGYCSDLHPSLVQLMQESTVTPGQACDHTAGKIITVEAQQFDFASTDIRHRIARGQSTQQQLYAAVEEYIARHSLYREQAD